MAETKSTIYGLPADIIPLRIRALDSSSDPVTGLSDVEIRISRTSDEQWLDFADDTFKASAHTTIALTLTETTRGYYKPVFNGSVDGFTLPAGSNTYIIEIDSVTAANMPQEASIIVRADGLGIDALITANATIIATAADAATAAAVDVSTIGTDLAVIKKATLNKSALAAGTTNNAVIYDDDGTTVWKQGNATDVNGNAVVLRAGDVAIVGPMSDP